MDENKNLNETANEQAAPKKKNKKARWLVALIVVALIGALIAVLLNLRIAGAGDMIEDEWKTPNYLRSKTMNILVLGADIDQDRAANEEATSTDVIILVNVDMENDKATLLQIPRDTYVGEDLVEYGKINGLYNRGYKENPEMNGVPALAETLYEQFSLPIDNYVLISMEGFRKAIDMLGGIEITLEATMEFDIKDTEGKVIETVVYEPGTHLLDSKMAEIFVRNRDYARADIARIDVQRYFLAALMNKATSLETSEMVSLATAIYPYLETDLSIQEILELALEVKGYSGDSITAIRVPGEPVPRYGMYGVDVFTMHKKALADLLNEYMRPHSEPVSETELGVIEIQNTTDILDDEGATLGDYGA